MSRNQRGPFDRLLIAQSIADDLVLTTADGRIARYDGLVDRV